jgi:hypothetical protein
METLTGTTTLVEKPDFEVIDVEGCMTAMSVN